MYNVLSWVLLAVVIIAAFKVGRYAHTYINRKLIEAYGKRKGELRHEIYILIIMAVCFSISQTHMKWFLLAVIVLNVPVICRMYRDRNLPNKEGE